MTKLYLDIDDTLLRHGQLLPGAEDLLRWAVERYDCFWLTTRDNQGYDGILRAFHDLLDESLIRKIKPTRWQTLKTESNRSSV